MNDTEKVVLKAVIENLQASTHSGWQTAGFDRWAVWAERMSATIKNQVRIMTGLLEIKE